MTRGDERGLSSVMAVVLLVGVVAVGSIGILLVGGSAVSENQAEAEDQRVQQSFRTLDEEIDSVAREDAASRQVDLALNDQQGGAVRESDTGRIVITRTNVTAGTTDEVVNRSIGSIVYEGENERYALQAGGVWRGTGNQTQMVSAPPVSYATNKRGTEPTLTFPIVETSGDRRLVGDDVRITHNETISPLNDVTVVEGDLIVVRVHSEYYVGWGEYFRTITNDAAVEYDHGNQTAIITMIVPTVAPPIEGGVVMGASAEDLKLKQKTVMDSYNSSAGDYAATKGSGTKVISAGDVYLKQDAKIKGSLEADGSLVDFKQDSRVTGHMSYGDSTSISHDDPLNVHVNPINQNASVAERTAVDGVIDRNVAFVREPSDNDNASESHISNGQLQGCASGCDLDAGAYYLDEIHLDGTDTLTLDTTGGPISVVVKGKVELDDSATIEVVGGGRVNVYIDSETGTEDLSLKQSSSVTVPGDHSPQMWFYMDSDAEAKLYNDADLTGVIYGPGPGDQPGTRIRLKNPNDVNVYGAIVGDVDPLGQDVSVHYDEALATATTVQTSTAVPRLTFLHASVYRVDVENGD